jgi:hypothetical protein
MWGGGSGRLRAGGGLSAGREFAKAGGRPQPRRSSRKGTKTPVRPRCPRAQPKRVKGATLCGAVVLWSNRTVPGGQRHGCLHTEVPPEPHGSSQRMGSRADSGHAADPGQRRRHDKLPVPCGRAAPGSRRLCRTDLSAGAGGLGTGGSSVGPPDAALVFRGGAQAPACARHRPPGPGEERAGVRVPLFRAGSGLSVTTTPCDQGSFLAEGIPPMRASASDIGQVREDPSRTPRAGPALGAGPPRPVTSPLPLVTCAGGTGGFRWSRSAGPPPHTPRFPHLRTSTASNAKCRNGRSGSC